MINSQNLIPFCLARQTQYWSASNAYLVLEVGKTAVLFQLLLSKNNHSEIIANGTTVKGGF